MVLATTPLKNEPNIFHAWFASLARKLFGLFANLGDVCKKQVREGSSTDAYAAAVILEGIRAKLQGHHDGDGHF